MSKKKPKNSKKIKDTGNSKPDVEENQKTTNLDKTEDVADSKPSVEDTKKTTLLDKVKKLSNFLSIIASIVVIVTFIASLSVIHAYISPYVHSSEIIREYAPIDYLSRASLNTPNYVLKTTEIYVIKPSYYPSIFSNIKIFSLPSNSFNIKVNPKINVGSDKFNYEINHKDKKIVFTFKQSRDSVENIEISFSYKQLINPKVVLIDYKGVVTSSIIEENLILENTENARITSFRANWIINDDEKNWIFDNLENNPDFIFVDNNKILPGFSRTTLNKTKVLIYNWDMDFEENEIKQVKIMTKTNVNYNIYGITSSINRSPFFEADYPLKEDNFEWNKLVLYDSDFPYPNETGYINGSRIISFPNAFNKTFYQEEYQNTKAKWNAQK